MRALRMARFGGGGSPSPPPAPAAVAVIPPIVLPESQVHDEDESESEKRSPDSSNKRFKLALPLVQPVPAADSNAMFVVMPSSPTASASASVSTSASVSAPAPTSATTTDSLMPDTHPTATATSLMSPVRHPTPSAQATPLSVTASVTGTPGVGTPSTTPLSTSAKKSTPSSPGLPPQSHSVYSRADMTALAMGTSPQISYVALTQEQLLEWEQTIIQDVFQIGFVPVAQQSRDKRVTFVEETLAEASRDASRRPMLTREFLDSALIERFNLPFPGNLNALTYLIDCFGRAQAKLSELSQSDMVCTISSFFCPSLSVSLFLSDCLSVCLSLSLYVCIFLSLYF
jgi:hypothetical protein